MAFNTKRATRMQQRSVEQLKKIVLEGTLSSAAAQYELKQRGIEFSSKKRT